MGGRANFAVEVLSEKQKVFQWMRKWMRENGIEEKNVASFDLPDLIILLQCAGFALHKFQSEDELNYTNPTSISGDTLKIELTCSKSGMRAEMLKPVLCCSCPQRDDIKTEEFFSVTSCAPSTKGSFDTSLTSFLPTITHSKQQVVGDIFKELITIIKSKNETTETDTHDVRVTIERMSLDPTKSLMQNLKDIKRVVDSFLGDKDKEEERPRVLEEKVKPPENDAMVTPPQSAEIKKKTIGAKKSIGGALSKKTTASVGNSNKNSSPVRAVVQSRNSVVKKSTNNNSNNKNVKVGRIAPVSQVTSSSLGGSTNKFGKVTRTKKSEPKTFKK